MRKLAFLMIGAAVSCATPAYATETITYNYDAKGRLVIVARTGTVNSGVTTSYAFDKADNRTGKAVIGAMAGLIVVPLNGFTILPILPAA